MISKQTKKLKKVEALDLNFLKKKETPILTRKMIKL